ncbi:MAG: PKD domain-containing protein, partial [Minicystis sp.]
MAAVLALLGFPAPASASPYGNFVALTSSGLPPGGDVSQVAVNASGELFATVYGDGVYRSTDGGETFVKLAPPNFGMTNDIPNVEMMTMIVNALGEPIIGCREVGASVGQYLFRLDWANRTWVAAAIPANKDISTDGYDPTGAQTIQIGGVSIPKQRRFPRHFTLDTNGAIWLGWSYIPGFLRSTDNGSTYQYIAAPIATTGLNAGIGPGNVYSFNQNKQTGEYFYGTEQNGFWHSTDGGNTWLPIDPTGATTLGTHQNDYSIGFNKDQEPIFANWGRSSALPAGGPVFTILDRSGAEVGASSGLTNYQFDKQNTFYQYNGGDAIMRNIRVDSVGYNFISAYSGNYFNNQVPNGGKQTVYLSLDGYTWFEADQSQPFVSPYANSLCTDGTDVFVGGTGKVWKFVINMLDHLPAVTLTPPPSTILYRAPVLLQGSATDADGEPLTYSWSARGPGNATFQTGTASSTIVSFDKPGDYVLTFAVNDGFRSASAGTIVHVIDTPPVVVTPASASVTPPSYVELSVLGDDAAAEGGEAGLIYTWIPEVVPAGATVTFSVNGNNASKTTRATVSTPGAYTFAVLIQDDGGQMVGSAASVVVNQVIGSLNVTPQSQFVPVSGTQQFIATSKDTSGALMVPQPTVIWTVDGGGTINGAGLFASDGVSTGIYTVRAMSGAVSQTATVMTVINDAPIFASPPSCTPGTVTLPGNGSLFVDVRDPDGVPGLGVSYVWSKISGPGNVTFTTQSSTLTNAAFSAAGVYQLRVDATDTLSSISNTITVVVNPDPTIPVAISLQNGVNGYTSEIDLG